MRSDLSSRGQRSTTSPGRLRSGIAALVAGLILGTFLSRVLAELPWVHLPFYGWRLTVTLALLAGTSLFLIGHRHFANASMTKRYPVAVFIPFGLLLFYIFQPRPNLLQAGVLLGGALAISALMPLALRSQARRPAAERMIALLLFLVPLAFYLSTLTPAVGERDGYELQAISATLGFAHPTGYPLFPILGRIWIAIFPVGSIAWRINVLCALFAALSVPLTYGLARQALGTPIAVWSALVWAFSRTLWTQASQPEKYTLNIFFVSLILYIAFGTTDPQARGPHPHLRWLAFAYGLSLTHHRTMLMLAPALVLYLLWRDPRLLCRPKEWLTALGLALAPLLIYLYIPWRAYAQGQAMAVSELLRYVSGMYYGAAVRLTDWLSPERAQMFWRFLVMQFGPVGIGFGVLGIASLALRRQWRFLLCTALAYFAYYLWGTVWYAYYNDVNSFLPNHLLFAVWMGSGISTVFQVLHAWKACDTWRDMALKPALGSLLALLPMWLIWTNYPQVDLSKAWGLTHWGRYAVAQDLVPNATLLADREKYPPLDYFARIERLRPDLDVVILGDEKAYLDRLVWDLAHGKTVYLARFLPGLDGPYHLRSLGPLVQVGEEPLTLADAPSLSAVYFRPPEGESLIGLLSHEVTKSDLAMPGHALNVTLFWHALTPVGGNYQVHLRMMDAREQVWWSTSHHPVNDMYPTAAWKVGEVIRDWYEVPIVEGMLPGEYTLEVGLFPPFSSQGLVYAEGQTWLPISKVRVGQSDARSQIDHPLRAVAPGRWQLLGYDLPTQAPPTGRVQLKLYWEALTWLPDYELGIRLLSTNRTGEWVWQDPGQGIYPTSQWRPGSPVVTAHELTMPAEKDLLTVQIAIREKDADGRRTEFVPVEFVPGWLAGRTTTLSLARLTVAGRPPSMPGTFNFQDRILLSNIRLSQETLTPGAPLDLVVEWQCLQAMDVDYTLFIQLLGLDGTLKGQIDVWPQDGTHPTSQWREGETIQDRYTVRLREDAPPGAYQVAVGWYLLETMQRLSLLDAQGQAVDDKVLLSGLQVVQ